jgi:integrase/recombinase XerD
LILQPSKILLAQSINDEYNMLIISKGELSKHYMPYQYAREPLRTEEADKLCHACETVLEKLIIWILLDTGLRVSELCGLNPQNILWQQKTIRISGKDGPYGKLSKKRIIPMSKRVQTLLEHYFAINDKWPIGKRQVQKIVKRVANRAKLTQNITPHILRHTFATLTLQKGISLAAVQKMLGHDRLTTTAIYLNFTDAHVVEEFSNKW